MRHCIGGTGFCSPCRSGHAGEAPSHERQHALVRRNQPLTRPHPPRARRPLRAANPPALQPRLLQAGHREAARGAPRGHRRQRGRAGCIERGLRRSVQPVHARVQPAQAQQRVGERRGTPVSWPSSLTTVTSASISTGLPASTSCSIEVLKAPSLRVTWCRSSGCCAIGMPMRCADLARLQHHAEMKPRTRSSFRIRSVVAPVMALIGLTVMLPHSLYQASFWICSTATASKPAFSSSATSPAHRCVSSRRRLADDQLVAEVVLHEAGRAQRAAGMHHAADDVPRGWRFGDAPSGSTASAACRPAPPKPWKNHQGTPFMAVSTMVSGPSSGPMALATSAIAGALTAMTTRSCTPSSAGLRWPSPAR
jgi:hypothetical protein